MNMVPQKLNDLAVFRVHWWWHIRSR